MSKASRKPRTARPPKPAPRPTGGWSVVKPLVFVLITVGSVVVGLLGLAELGRRAGQGLGNRDRYEAHFSDIECNTPPELTREAFLKEVMQAGHSVETFQLLEPDTPAKVGAAFTAHPWVESVESVKVEQPGIVRVSLKFRNPILAVTVTGSKEPYLLDSYAILLPRHSAPNGLAVLANPVPPPVPRVGEPWPNEFVKRAVELVGVYRPVRLEKNVLGWKLTMPDGKELLVERSPR